MSITHTYTYAVLEVSPEAHAEIKAKLLAAGYHHAIDGDTIDMQGIALEPNECHGSRLRFSASVYPDRVDFETHSRDVTWQQELDALNALRGEIERLIVEGPGKCPAAPPSSLTHALLPQSGREPFQNVKRDGDKISGEIVIEWEPARAMIVDEQAFNRS